MPNKNPTWYFSISQSIGIGSKRARRESSSQGRVPAPIWGSRLSSLLTSGDYPSNLPLVHLCHATDRHPWERSTYKAFRDRTYLGECLDGRGPPTEPKQIDLK